MTTAWVILVSIILQDRRDLRQMVSAMSCTAVPKCEEGLTADPQPCTAVPKESASLMANTQ